MKSIHDYRTGDVYRDKNTGELFVVGGVQMGPSVGLIRAGTRDWQHIGIGGAILDNLELLVPED